MIFKNKWCIFKNDHKDAFRIPFPKKGMSFVIIAEKGNQVLKFQVFITPEIFTATAELPSYGQSLEYKPGLLRSALLSL